MSRTDWLLPYENPLKKRKPREFFAGIPRAPGIYVMHGAEDCVLYVGKAKSLRDRLNSYRHAKPQRAPRKVIRLLNLVREIRWEECADETAALLRENALIRELKPPFNAVNKHPESYYFIGIRIVGRRRGAEGVGQVRFRLTCDPRRQGDLLYGAFKGRRLAREAYTALLRLLWAAQFRGERFEFPQKLTRRSPPYLFTLDVPAAWHTPLKSFLNGTDENEPPLLLRLLAEALLGRENIPAFFYAMIQADLDRVRDFYVAGPRRNRRLRLRHRIRGRVIAQDRIDDLLALGGE